MAARTNRLKYGIWVTWITGVLLLSCEGREAVPRNPIPLPDWLSNPANVRLAVLQHSFWEGGFTRPLFLAYRDGRLLTPLFAKEGIPATYGLTQWPESGIDSLLIAFGLEAALSYPDSMIDYAPNTTDQHSFYLVMPSDTGHQVVQLRASLKEPGRLRARVPPALSELLANVVNTRFTGAEPWWPDSLDVHVWAYDRDHNDPPPEAEGLFPPLPGDRWTRLDDPDHSNPDEGWSIRVPFSYSAEFEKLIGTEYQTGTVGFGGRKWVLSYRWVFPYEEEWRWLVDRLH